MLEGKKILVAPLNWGLGHATRCIPLIHALIQRGVLVYLASDGVALRLLKHEFPELPAFELPSYNVKYASKGQFFKLKMIFDSPKLLAAMAKERLAIEKLIVQEEIDGLISDNRMGALSRKVPSVFISHQLNVLSGSTTWISSTFHQEVIRRFKECWVPDFDREPNLTGRLGHLKNPRFSIRYTGPLSRFEKRDLPKKFPLMVLLSGPEPQRTFLEEKLMVELHAFEGHVLFVRGKIEDEKTKEVITTPRGSIELVNFMQSEELEKALNSSELIISRSGYTTVMDLAKLGKKAFFIPTPGQYEQVYLAERLEDQQLIPYCSQDSFSLKELERVAHYKGFTGLQVQLDYDFLFSIFSSVKENSEPTSSSLST